MLAILILFGGTFFGNQVFWDLLLEMIPASVLPFGGDINIIRKNYDISNPVIVDILKAKEERLKILQELKKEHQEEFSRLKLESKSRISKKSRNTKPVSEVSVRRSVRLQNSPCVKYGESVLTKLESIKTHIIRPPNDYGSIPGIEIGTHWETRMECSSYGVHRPTVAGIHGGPDGAYSIALSGGYPEDVDEGNFFIYTGAGGRDLKGTSAKPKNLRVAPQTKDQQLEGTNLSLVKSIESKLPVRVIRGYKSPSAFAPETGYRYDGLYQVVEYWEAVGKTGHRIYRFKMERMKDQAPPPWETNTVKKILAIKADKTVEDEFNVCNDESEFKENLAPDSYRNMSSVKDVDNEIKTCIEFFCKVATIKYEEDLGKDSEEEFYGWD